MATIIQADDRFPTLSDKGRTKLTIDCTAGTFRANLFRDRSGSLRIGDAQQCYRAGEETILVPIGNLPTSVTGAPDFANALMAAVAAAPGSL